MERSCGLAVFEAFHPPAKGLLPPKLRDASKRWVQLFSCTFFFIEEDVLNKKHVAVSSHMLSAEPRRLLGSVFMVACSALIGVVQTHRNIRIVHDL